MGAKGLGQHPWAQGASWIPGPPLTRSVTLYKLFQISVPQCLNRLVVGIKCVKTCKEMLRPVRVIVNA